MRCVFFCCIDAPACTRLHLVRNDSFLLVIIFFYIYFLYFLLLQKLTERKCKYDMEKFCYICGKFISGERCSIISTTKLQNVSTCHSLKILAKCGHHVMLVVPPKLICCNGWQEREKMSFAIPRIWCETQFYGEKGCYFCSVTLGIINSKPYYLSLKCSIAPYCSY